MKEINLIGAVVGDDDYSIYEWLGYQAVCPKKIKQQLSEANGDPIRLRINSPGGSVHSGFEIYTALKTYPGDVEILIEGLAASIASVIATSRRCIISPVANIMIHNASGRMCGDYRDMESMANVLKAINDSIVSAYISKSNLDKGKLLNMMDAETWMTAEQALQYGFADEILDHQTSGVSFGAKGSSKKSNNGFTLSNDERAKKAQLELQLLELKGKQVL